MNKINFLKHKNKQLNGLTLLKTFRKKSGLFILVLLCLSLPLHSYVGPGAGFAFLSSFLVLFLTFFLAIFSFLSWPFRFFFRLIRGQKAYKKSLVDRLVVVGLDGMESKTHRTVHV